MKIYRVCVESYLSNNSEVKEYDNYYCKAKNWKEAEDYAKRCIENWNKQSEGVVYNIYDLTPHN